VIIIKTGIYVRVSTEEQAKEGFSIRAQQEKLKDYIKIKGWELYDVYTDEGISGKNITERPAINRLIADIMKKKVENVLVFKIDRLTRSTKDLIELTELFNENNCTFNSLMESIDTQTASGRMFLKIIGIFAEFERENLIERISVAMEKKVREGYTLPTFGVPYGYSREIKNREITIDEEQSKIIKEIFSMYLNKHMTFNAIASTLNLRKIETNNNATWGGSTIRYILTNPIYIGKVRYSIHDESKYFETEGKHEAIISEEIFTAVQNKLSKMETRVYKKRPKEENYYCGTLMCGICGAKMSTHGIYNKDKDGNQLYYSSYRCTNVIKGKCQTGVISHNKVETAFKEYIEHIKDFEVENEIEVNKNQNAEPDNLLLKSEYETSLSKLLQKEQNIMTLYINDKIDYDEYNKMLSLIKIAKAEYEAKIAEIENTEIIDVKLQKEDIVTNFKENWDLLTQIERLQFLKTYIKAIYITSEPDNEQPPKKLVKVKKVEFHQN